MIFYYDKALKSFVLDLEGRTVVGEYKKPINKILIINAIIKDSRDPEITKEIDKNIPIITDNKYVSFHNCCLLIPSYIGVGVSIDMREAL